MTAPPLSEPSALAESPDLGELPAGKRTPTGRPPLRLLHAASLQRSGGWLGEALAAEGVGRSDIDEAVGVTATLARLREASFDVVVVSHEPGVLDAVGLVEGLRVAGQEEAVIVLTDQLVADLELACYEAGVDGVCCVTHATARSLLAAVERAIHARQIVRENRQLQEAERQRLAAEHRAAEQTLADQRQLVNELEAIGREQVGDQPLTASTLNPTSSDLSDALVRHYRDLLRAYVIMGAGNLASEMHRLAELLASERVSAERVIQMHLAALEELLAGLGQRSARHVMNRADLLVLELVAKLADGYRRRYHERTKKPQQLTLPGFAPDEVLPQPVLADPTSGDPLPGDPLASLHYAA